MFYQAKDAGLEFVQNQNEICKVYLLKDISSKFRRNPKNQLQVNISDPVEYRSRTEFIELLFKKLKESHERQIEISTKALKTLDAQKQSLLEANKKSEKKLLKNLK